MGIFGTIVSGIGDAIHWVDSNSGSIAEAALAIAKVAGLVLGPANENTTDKDPTNIPIQEDFSKVNRYLEKTAAAQVDCHDLSKDMMSAQITGIWTDPMKTAVSGEPSPDMYRDIARMFSLHRLCPVMSGVDVPHRIAQVMAEIDKPFQLPHQTTVANDSPLRKVDIIVKGDTTDPEYRGCYMYYAIPMGKGGTENAWHGSLYIQQWTDKGSTMALLREQEEFYYFQQLPPPDVDSWCVTCQIDWQNVQASRSYANGVRDKFCPTAIGPPPEFRAEYSHVLGDVQTLKIRAPAKYALPEIRGKVITAIDSVLKTPTENPPKTGPGVAQQRPEVTTTAYAFIVGKKSL